VSQSAMIQLKAMRESKVSIQNSLFTQYKYEILALAGVFVLFTIVFLVKEI
jgi:hypothetical protein